MPAEMFYTLPVSFYGYDSLIYIISAIIGFTISYKAYRLYKLTRERNHALLYASFAILAVGLLTIMLTSSFTYMKYFTEGEELVFNQLFDIADLGYWVYFSTAFLGYALLVLMYLPKTRPAFLLALPITLNYFSYFNIILFLLMAFVAFRGTINYFSHKTKESFLVMSGFLLILVYHGVLLFTPFAKIFYVAAHISLILGFASLLYMLIRVNRVVGE